MNGTFGSEVTFLTKVVEGRSDPRATMLRYGALVDDVAQLFGVVATSQTASQVLTGMINQRQLVALSAAEIDCLPKGNPAAEFREYLKLGICCNGVFIHDLEMDADTKLAFTFSGTHEVKSNEVDYSKLLFSNPTNAVRSWILTEGGGQSPDALLGPYVSCAKSITIYDPYFGHLAVRALEALLAHLAQNGPIRAKVLILIGRGDGGLNEADIAQSVYQFFDDPASDLVIAKCEKAPGANSNVHDRYLQVDTSHTIVFSAGVGCFYASGGRNRASTVFLHDLYISYGEVAVRRIDDGSVVRIRY